MTANAFASETEYRNLLEVCQFETGKPLIDSLTQVGTTQVKRVALKAGTELKCHKTSHHVLVLWLRGKALFSAHDETFTMHPGSLLEMPTGTPHSALAETDCIFAIFKFETA
jgi:quercetin dioxygenase-like cupin family protein